MNTIKMADIDTLLKFNILHLRILFKVVIKMNENIWIKNNKLLAIVTKKWGSALCMILLIELLLGIWVWSGGEKIRYGRYPKSITGGPIKIWRLSIILTSAFGFFFIQFPPDVLRWKLRRNIETISKGIWFLPYWISLILSIRYWY